MRRQTEDRRTTMPITHALYGPRRGPRKPRPEKPAVRRDGINTIAGQLEGKLGAGKLAQIRWKLEGGSTRRRRRKPRRAS